MNPFRNIFPQDVFRNIIAMTLLQVLMSIEDFSWMNTSDNATFVTEFYADNGKDAKGTMTGFNLFTLASRFMMSEYGKTEMNVYAEVLDRLCELGYVSYTEEAGDHTGLRYFYLS